MTVVSIVISVGFDTYFDEPLGFFRLRSSDYREIGKRLAKFRLPTLFVQEGGYNIEAQGLLAEQLIQGFLDH
jgi:acetoin utilization deacetylase AcuC-like enzyme